MSSVTVPYLAKNGKTITLEFTDDDFIPASVEGKNESPGSLFQFFHPLEWQTNPYASTEPDQKEWVKYITTNATTSQEFLSVFHVELNTLFNSVVNTPNRRADAIEWRNRLYYPVNQKGKKKERIQTFAAYLYKKLKTQLGLRSTSSSQKKFNADGTPYVPLQERLESCGMGYFGDCKYSDLKIMYNQASSMLGKHQKRVVTPGMVMAKVFEMEYEEKDLTAAQEIIYEDKLQRLKNSHHGTKNAFMSAIMHAAQELGSKEAAEGQVIGGKTEENNGIKPRAFRISKEKLPVLRKKKNQKDLAKYAEEIEARNKKKKTNRRKRGMAFNSASE